MLSFAHAGMYNTDPYTKGQRIHLLDVSSRPLGNELKMTDEYGSCLDFGFAPSDFSPLIPFCSLLDLGCASHRTRSTQSALPSREVAKKTNTPAPVLISVTTLYRLLPPLMDSWAERLLLSCHA